MDIHRQESESHPTVHSWKITIKRKRGSDNWNGKMKDLGRPHLHQKGVEVRGNLTGNWIRNSGGLDKVEGGNYVAAKMITG